VKLTIVSPHYMQEYMVAWIEAQTPVGFVIIEPEHAPIILSLVAGSYFSFMLDTHEQKTITLTRPGFLEVTRESAMVLIGA
jgi:F0F1-type ATP synthase epsilon subunit